jgi:hypothetical protein
MEANEKITVKDKQGITIELTQKAFDQIKYWKTKDNVDGEDFGLSLDLNSISKAVMSLAKIIENVDDIYYDSVVFAIAQLGFVYSHLEELKN